MKLSDLYKPLPGALPGILIAVAVTSTAQARALDEPDSKSEFTHAVAAYSAGQLDEAELAFEKLIERFPDDPSVLNNLAVIVAKKNNIDRAIELFKRAIATDEAIDVGYRNLSAIYAHLASLSYRDALSLESGQPQPLSLNLIGESAEDTEENGALPEAAAQAANSKEADEPLVRDPEVPVLSKHTRDIVLAVRQWARTWSRQDTDAYFASYVGNYTPSGEPHRDWKRKRRERVTAPKRIEINLSNIRVHMKDETAARVTFVQKYRSNLLSSTVIKRLQMEKVGDTWKIAREQVI